MFSFLRRHWRGELPLSVAWWINGVLLTAASLALEFNAPAFLDADALATRAGFSAYLAGSVLLLLLLPAWQVIGLFRAGERHAAQVGTLLAARLVQAMTTVLAVLLATRFMGFAGEAASGARLAYSLGGSAYSVRVVESGRVLEISGGLTFGVADDAGRLLAASPGVRRVRLNSSGGSLQEARRLRTLIRSRNLDTDSTTGCSSACVSAYIGGRQRLLARSAKLGFHLPRNPGFGIRNRLTAEYRQELGFFALRGVPRWFIERWILTGRRFWYPNPRQLKAAGLVHAYFGRPRPGEEFYFL